MTLTCSHDPSQRLMYKGVEPREGHLFSLTLPSHFQPLTSKRIRFDALQAFLKTCTFASTF